MKKFRPRVFAWLLTLAVLMSLSLSALAEEGGSGSTTVEVSAGIHQDEAREVLELVNDLRQEENAWYLNEAGERVDVPGLAPLAWDADLEKAAIQRAAELSVSFSGSRPDGSYGSSAYPGTVSESIAQGAASASSAFSNWDGSSSSVRRNMLSVGTEYNAVGAACVEVDGVYYWVQVLGVKADVTPAGAAETGTRTIEVKVGEDLLKDRTWSLAFAEEVSSLSLDEGASYTLPNLIVTAKDSSGKEVHRETVSPSECVITVSDPTVAEVSADGVVTALKGGTVEISVSWSGSLGSASTSVSASVTGKEIVSLVTPSPLSFPAGEDPSGSFPSVESAVWSDDSQR